MKKRPNILLFFTDQQRFDTIHALGNPVIRTPHLDRLCREGAAFTSTYSPSPVCVPARCSMHYGQYPMNTGCYNNGMPMPDTRSFMDVLTRAGYRTHGVGKCHFTPDGKALRGFETRDIQEELSGPGDDYRDWLIAEGLGYVEEPHGMRGEMYYIPQPSMLPPEKHPVHWIGDRSIQFLEEQSGGDRPWMLFSSFIHPHPPFAPPVPWHKLYRAPLMPLPKVPQDPEHLHTFINRKQNRYKYRDQGIDQNLTRNIKAFYYACISFIDYQVGRVLATLEKTGQLDDTLILFTADHGEHLGDYNCFGKRSMHDTCARVPLLARLPGRFEGGRRCDTPVSLVDVAPTLFGATGVDGREMALDGVDLANVLNGAAERDTVHSQIGREGERQGGAIYTTVTPRWKYAYSAPDDKEFLFDRVMDPQETRNRAGLRMTQAALKALREKTMDWLRSGGETDGLDGEHWRRIPAPEISDDPDTGLLIQDSGWRDLDLPGYTHTDQA